MEAALGAANWLLGQVLNKLSDDLVKPFVSSIELGLNLEQIEREMLYTRGLLSAAQGRDITGNPGLEGLLQKLGKKADEAEDALDELHYFIIQDKLDGTQEATPDLGGGLSAKAQHARHAARHTSEDNTVWFPSLRELRISRCPKLCLPPMPHTSMVSRIQTEYLSYDRGHYLDIMKPFQLVPHNLGDVERLTTEDALLLSFMDLQKLHSLRHIEVNRCEETFLRGLDDGVVLHKVQSLELKQFPLTRKSMSNLFKCFPDLSRLMVRASSDEDHEEVVLHFPSSSSLREVHFHRCKNLILPVEEEEGAGFGALSSLKSVTIINCDKLFSRWSMGGGAAQTQSIIYPLPPCLKVLRLRNQQSTLPMALLANLTSITSLELVNCQDITVDGLDPLITSNLEHLEVYNKRHYETVPHSVAGDLLTAVSRTIQTMPVGSFQLVHLTVDSISAVLVAPICCRLSATLQRLYFNSDWRMEKFTEEQDEALQLLTSLQRLVFDSCGALQSLPQGLHRLPSLQELYIWGAHKIGSLPKEGLPDSLRRLDIQNCGAEIYEECQKLKGTRPDIDIFAYIAEAES